MRGPLTADSFPLIILRPPVKRIRTQLASPSPSPSLTPSPSVRVTTNVPMSSIEKKKPEIDVEEKEEKVSEHEMVFDEQNEDMEESSFPLLIIHLIFSVLVEDVLLVIFQMLESRADLRACGMVSRRWFFSSSFSRDAEPAGIKSARVQNSHGYL